MAILKQKQAPKHQHSLTTEVSLRPEASHIKYEDNLSHQWLIDKSPSYNACRNSSYNKLTSIAHAKAFLTQSRKTFVFVPGPNAYTTTGHKQSTVYLVLAEHSSSDPEFTIHQLFINKHDDLTNAEGEKVEIFDQLIDTIEPELASSSVPKIDTDLDTQESHQKSFAWFENCDDSASYEKRLFYSMLSIERAVSFLSQSENEFAFIPGPFVENTKSPTLILIYKNKSAQAKQPDFKTQQFHVAENGNVIDLEGNEVDIDTFVENDIPKYISKANEVKNTTKIKFLPVPKTETQLTINSKTEDTISKSKFHILKLLLNIFASFLKPLFKQADHQTNKNTNTAFKPNSSTKSLHTMSQSAQPAQPLQQKNSSNDVSTTPAPNNNNRFPLGTANKTKQGPERKFASDSEILLSDSAAEMMQSNMGFSNI